MTIVNMIGGQGGEPESSTESLNLYFRTNSSSGLNNIGAYVTVSTYTLENRNYSVETTDNSKTMYTEVKYSGSASGQYYINLKIKDVNSSYDTLAPYLMSQCPEGKTFIAKMSGIACAVNSDLSGLRGGVPTTMTASGDSSVVNYSFPGNVGYSVLSSGAYVVFIPTSIFIEYS